MKIKVERKMKISPKVFRQLFVLSGLFLFCVTQSAAQTPPKLSQSDSVKQTKLSFTCPDMVKSEVKTAPADWKTEGGWNAFLTGLVIGVPKNINGAIIYDWKESAFWDGKGGAPKIMCQYGGNVFGGMAPFWLTRTIPAGYKCVVNNLQPNRIPIAGSIDCTLFKPPTIK